MRISQKKNCNRCKAFAGDYCELGYTFKKYAYDTHGFTMFGVPDAPCPKPLSFGDYMFATKYYANKSFNNRQAQTAAPNLPGWPGFPPPL